MYESYAALRFTPDVEWVVPQLTSKGEAYLTETSSLLEQYVDYVSSVGYDYRKNPWYGYINQDTSYQAKSEVKSDLTAVVQLLQALIPLLQEISEKYEINCTSIEDAHVWKTFFDFAAISQIITPSLLRKECFDAVNSALNGLQAQSADILSSRSVLDAVFDDDIYKLDGAAYHKKLTKQFSGTFSRLFNSEYKQLVTALCLCKKDGKKPSYSEAVAMTERLAYYQQKIVEYAEAEAPIKEFLGTAYKGVETEWGYVTAQMDALQAIFSTCVSFGLLENYSDFASERNTFADYAQRLEAAFVACKEGALSRIAGCFDNTVLDINTVSCSLLLVRFSDCLNEMDKLDHWCHFRSLLYELDDKQVVSYIQKTKGLLLLYLRIYFVVFHHLFCNALLVPLQTL